MFKHSIRFLNRQKGYLLINITGLSVGIAFSMIIALFIIHEMSYDQYNEKKDRIFRLVRSGTTHGQDIDIAYTCAPVGPAMMNEFPEVEDFTRIHLVSGTVVKYLDKSFIENDFIESDSSFFNIFSIPLLSGDKNTVLKATHKLVLSESTAKKIFGNDNPINKMLKVGNNEVLYSVAGIMADIPETSHFNANIIGSFMTNTNENDNDWGHITLYTYLLLKANTDPEQVNAKMQQFYIKYHTSLFENAMGISLKDFFAEGNRRSFYLQSIKDIHLNPTIKQSMKPAYDPKYLLILGSVAILIIIVAAINFMNLSTAQASKRAKEVGIKKVSGSSKGMLFSQFMTESVVLSFLSLMLAIIIVENSLLYFNNLLGAKLQMNLFSNWYTIPLLLVLAIFIGMLAGSYPAFYLSSFDPFTILKGKLRDTMKNVRIRSILVILQFSISIILITGTFIMLRQIRYMLKKNLGFNKEQLLVISRAEALNNQVKPFKDAVSKIPEVLMSTASTHIPGHSESGASYTLESRDGQLYNLTESYIDYDFLETYGMILTSGRAFNEAFATDKDACIVNESAIKQLNLTNPLDTSLIGGRQKVTIVGVVKNFHFESLRNEIGPYVFRVKTDNRNYGYITVRLSERATSNTVSEIEKVWNEFAPNDPIRFFFMDQDFAQKYKAEKQNAQLSVLFTLLAIIIASLGLFGLTSYTIEKRTKEIGIRKTMGASSVSVFFFISKEFILLVSISTIISWPLIYYVANHWLQNFYYRINPRPFDFLVGFIMAMIIAMITISYRTIRSARTNPIEALRYE